MDTDKVTLHCIATGSLLVVSFAGVALPYLVLHTNVKLLEATWFQLTRVLCTGLVIGVALLHVLADAQEYLSRVSDYPVADAAALVGIFLMVAVKELGIMMMSYLRQHGTLNNSKGQLEEGLLDVEAHHGVGHTHSVPGIDLHDINLTGKPLQRFVVYMMETSIMVHSVLVGVALGVLQSRVAILSLGAALLFHQFFEGIALGSVAIKSDLCFKSAWHLFLTFTLSCPLGVVLGIVFVHQYDPKGYRTAWTLGLLNALAAGMLLHIGLVELLPEDFAHTEKFERTPHPLARLLALCVGGIIMAVLAVWA
eukprot:TRINITY_DN41339_c0_g1_i1.p1 TRINITY_DN41339_c0_g1~~TRINITY_DN41339_c0_g1_i1.p1  ORF type:complete len:336 (+),score=51.45 TRINITY_DN41339_c0_g1_i1:84-1010(+)